MSKEIKPGDIVLYNGNLEFERTVLAVHNDLLWLDKGRGRAVPFTGYAKNYTKKVEVFVVGKTYAHNATGNRYEVVAERDGRFVAYNPKAHTAQMLQPDWRQYYSEIPEVITP